MTAHSSLPSKVREKFELQGLSILRVYPDDSDLRAYPREQLNRNVYAFGGDGRLRWQIEEAPHGGERDKPYMAIRIVDGVLVAGNWTGVDYVVDLHNGHVAPRGTGKRPW